MKQEQNFIYFDSLEPLLNWRLPNSSSVDDKENLLLAACKLENFQWQINSPRTLVCHDHRGGYLPYERLCGSSCTRNKEDEEAAIPFYSFFHWWYIDVFVYFSHHFVTVPPNVWTNQAHKHGVLMLGTFITEADEIFKEIFSNEENVERLISIMVQLCKAYNFDGWLINIENKIEAEQLDKLEYFLKKLRNELRREVHDCTQLIWYDSVTENGELKWQNELNNSNKRWFGAVDGFYTNYNWKEEHIHRTLVNLFNCLDNKSEPSPLDVYIGIDVFGRGCLGGGGWNCIEPMEIIRRYGLSAAIFAPGWICEKFANSGQQCLFENSIKYWNGLKQHLHPHKITNRNIQTNFSIGFASESLPANQSNGCEEDNHFCMLNASIQPFYLNSLAFSKDLCSGLIINHAGTHELFLCDILLQNCDRGMEFRFQASNPLALIITVSNGNETQHLLLESQQVTNQTFQIELKREKIPKEERLSKFHELLQENNINAASVWEDELPNLVFDDRYLLLGAVERKQAFDAYCQEVTAQSEEKERAQSADASTLEKSCQKIMNEDIRTAWLPLPNKSGWHIQKVALWPPHDAQNFRLYFFEFSLK